MKKIIVLLVALALILPLAPARADNEGAYILGGVIGGLVLGEILENDRPYRPYGYPVYVEEPVYEKQCYTRWVKRWSEHRQAWIRKKKTHCDWVRVY